jgi:hypothetical protein
LCVQISETDIPNGECDDISPACTLGSERDDVSLAQSHEGEGGPPQNVPVQSSPAAANVGVAHVGGRARLQRGNGEQCMLNAP